MSAQPKSGLFKASLADLFMNLALVIVWLLFMSPSHPPVDAVPDQSIPPTDQKPGDRPAAGQQVARVNVQPDGEIAIQAQGKTFSYEQYQVFLSEDPAAFPDHLVVAFDGFQQLQLIGQAALQHDANVSIELKR